MKILVVSNMYPDEKHPSYGVFVKNFCEQLGILGIEYDLSVMLKGDNAISKIINYCSFYIKTFIKCVSGKYDLVYVHYASHSGVPVLLANKFKKNIIYTNVHGSDVVPENQKQEKMQHYTKEILSISKKIITPSYYFKNLVVDKYGVNKDSVHVIYSGGVDKKTFYVEPTQKNRSEQNLRLGYVGRITRKKGWRTLLDACEQIKYIPMDLIIVGNGPEENKLKARIEQLGYKGNIERYNLLNQEELRTIYNKMDLFIFPTEGESLGLVGLEAMACGIPVIVTEDTAPADYVKNGKNGYTFILKDSLDLSNKIHEFYKLSVEEKMKMKKEAQKTAEQFSVEIVLEQMRAVLVQNEENKTD